MKQIIKYVLTGLSVISFQFCDLDTNLYQNIPSENAYNSIQDVQNGMNGAYQRFGYYTFYGKNVVALSDMVSNISIGNSSTGHYNAFSGWTFNEYSPELIEIWTAGYNIIDRCTRGINGGKALINDAQKNSFSDSEVNELNSYISQMYSLRAISNLMLVNIFGLPYQAGEANSQKGIVLIKDKPIKEFEQVQRATVGETYSHIFTDIESAKEYMSKLSAKEKEAINQYYFNEAAIYALEARARLYMQDYDKALVAAQKTIDLRGQSNETFESYVAMWKSTAITKEDIFTIVKSEADNLSANALNTLYGSYKATISSKVIKKLGANDIRLELINGSHPMKFDGTATAQAVSNVPVFRKSEMYLIIAEANIKKANEDVAKAKEALLFSAKRNKDIVSVNDLPDSKSELVNFISDERVREFFQEGHRYYDLRRTGEKDTISVDVNYQMSSFVFPIPDKEVQSGFGVDQNTDWHTKVPKK